MKEALVCYNLYDDIQLAITREVFMSNEWNEQFDEYTTFVIKLSDGKDHEFAIVEEFDHDEKHYVLVSEVKDDTVTEGVYMFRAQAQGEDFYVEEIEDKAEYAQAVAAYEAMYQ